MSKPIPAINRYHADLRELQFLLFEQFNVEERARPGAASKAGATTQSSRRSTEALQMGARGHRPAQRDRRRRGLPPRGRQGDHADRLQGRVEEALRGGLEVDRRRRRVRRRRRAAHGAAARRGDALGRQRRVHHVPRARLRRRRGHRGVRHARAEGALLRAHVQRQVGRHDVPHRAAGRLRRRLGAHQGDASNADGTYSIARHQDLHLGGRSRSRREHRPPRARARRRRAGGHQGPHALHRAEAAHRRRRQARRAQRRRRSAPSSTRWASTARRPACSTSARTASASACPSAATPS